MNPPHRKSEMENLLEYTESICPSEGKRKRPDEGVYCELNNSSDSSDEDDITTFDMW